MPRTARFSFAYNSIILDHHAIQTRRALSRVKANYHLFLRNQPKGPQFKTQDLGPSRKWQVPKMKNIEDREQSKALGMLDTYNMSSNQMRLRTLAFDGGNAMDYD
ncbi:hypothetical protein HRR83_004199 [Exophiala dermatitidis]|uniref:Uncharacterized protein n=1 Tax=Exophiala dermatitidis TaxID=5970 RepID=A0AAN6ETP2_EXODE